MKLLSHILILIAVIVGIVWGIWGLTPRDQWEAISNWSSRTAEHISDTEESAIKLKNMLGDHFQEAADIYHGKKEKDPFIYTHDYSQDEEQE